MMVLMSTTTSNRTSKSSLVMMPATTIRTTLALPADLLEAVDRLVEQGKARSRNDLIANALRRELAVLERAVLDAEFRQMETDADYQRETRQILTEFAQSDWEAWGKRR